MKRKPEVGDYYKVISNGEQTSTADEITIDPATGQRYRYDPFISALNKAADEDRKTGETPSLTR